MSKFDFSNSVNWLLVFVGCLIVGGTAHNLTLSQSQFEEAFKSAVVSALNRPAEPVERDFNAMSESRASSQAAYQQFSAQQRQNSPPMREAEPTQPAQSSNPDGIPNYISVPSSETDRLGM